MGTGVRGRPTLAGPGSALERGADLLYRGYRKPKGKHDNGQEETALLAGGDLGRPVNLGLTDVGSKKKPASGEAGE
jgi:hypothetical protein